MNIKQLITGMTKGKASRGIIHAIDMDKIDVRVNGSGVIRNVEVVGDVGQLRRGMEVNIMWDAVLRRPVAFTSTIIPDASPVETTDAMAGNDRITLLGDGIALTYPPDEKGLNTAVANAFDGCSIFIPRGVYSTSIDLPSGVALIGQGRGVVKIIGTVSGGNLIKDLYVLNSVTLEPAYLYTGGVTTLQGCLFASYCDYAVAVGICGNGDLALWNCELIAEGVVSVGISTSYGIVTCNVYGGKISAEKIYDMLTP